MIKPMLDSMQVTPEGGHHPFQQPIASSGSAGQSAPQAAATNVQSPSIERQPPSADLPKLKDLNLPTFTVDRVTEVYTQSKTDIHSKCSEENQKLLDEFCEYLSTAQPTWSPSPRHIGAFGKGLLVSSEQKSTSHTCLDLRGVIPKQKTEGLKN